ncbi:uncharacterized protein N7483_012798 [Penicillium malachiteum]|uniref:uncharacterized protein n=1 Tax=Penicillium malachiteum TaxID=1324776 RepID=UPI0025491D74|nr:uncharacterized protein N7483_012798 [Penicillium malachiteum]KAJ5715617.1 hypothetical protein N7483_012798 [Penicillium malachiteum]
MKLPATQYQDRDVRISFLDSGQNGPRWYSEIGSDALNITDQRKPTMRLTWYTDTEYLAMKHNILHEFGHMLGALHEHCSPDFPFEWNCQAIYHDYEVYIRREIQRTGQSLTPSQITSRAQQRANDDIIKKPNRHNLRCSTFDDQSVMLYTIEKRWLQPNISDYPPRRTLGKNYNLSYFDGALTRILMGL